MCVEFIEMAGWD